MRANEVSIVVCANCGHSHPLSTCDSYTLTAHGVRTGILLSEESVEVCGCEQWHPILKPFSGLTPHQHEHEHWGWKVLAWAALIGLFAYALVSKGGM